jgi:type II secretory pathway component PulF
MEQVQGWLPEFDVALLSVGEKAGRLDSTFRLLANYYATRAKIIRDAITGMLMTIVTLHVFLMVFPLSSLIGFVKGIFDGDYSLCLPFVLGKILCFGILYGSVFVVAFLCQGGRGEGARAMVERVTQCVPVLRTAQRYLVLSRVAAALEALVNAGVSIVTGWEMAARASGSPSLQRLVASWKPKLEMGQTPGALVSEADYFPATFADLYATGEHSGKLDETLRRLQTYYQEEGFRTLKIFTGILNGVVYALVVVVVAYNIIQFWTNYYGGMVKEF